VSAGRRHTDVGGGTRLSRGLGGDLGEPDSPGWRKLKPAAGALAGMAVLGHDHLAAGMNQGTPLLPGGD